LLWYGSKKHSLLVTKKKKSSSHKQTRLKLFKNPQNSQNNKITYNLYVPSIWKSALITNMQKKKQYLYLYSSAYFFKLPLPSLKKSITFDRNSNLFKLNTLYTNALSRTFFKNFSKCVSTFTLPIFKKIKFKGKGYYIYKNYRNTITPQFGHSHRMYLYSFFTPVKFLTKTSILLFGTNKSDILNSSKKIKALRPINIFTGRGVRFSKQPIYKKAGKVSAYR
jgi:ribosomal protein L6P/L9E